MVQGKRRYDRKMQGFGGQKKPIFHKKAKVPPPPPTQSRPRQQHGTRRSVRPSRCQSCRPGSNRPPAGAPMPDTGRGDPSRPDAAS